MVHIPLICWKNVEKNRGKMSKGKISKWKNIEKEKCRKGKCRRGKMSRVRDLQLLNRRNNAPILFHWLHSVSVGTLTFIHIIKRVCCHSHLYKASTTHSLYRYYFFDIFSFDIFLFDIFPLRYFSFRHFSFRYFSFRHFSGQPFSYSAC